MRQKLAQVLQPMLGPIERDVCYPLEVFKQISGQGRNALAAARRDGLEVIKRGNRKYVMGSAWIDFLKEHGTTEGGA